MSQLMFTKHTFFRNMTRVRHGAKGQILVLNTYHVDQIKHDSTCITLDLPLSLQSTVCQRKGDIHTKKQPPKQATEEVA